MYALFDLDGTLCDPLEGIALGFRHALAAVGRPFPGDAAVAALIGRPLLECFQTLGCGAASADAAERFHAFFVDRGRAEGRLYDGVPACLEALRAGGWRLALASAKPTFAVRMVADALALSPFLDGAFGCPTEVTNPDKAAIVGEALGSLGWEARRTVLVGDRSQDRDAAAAHGLRFVAVRWGFGAGGEHAGAVAVAEAPADLPALLESLRG